MQSDLTSSGYTEEPPELGQQKAGIEFRSI